MNEDLGKIKLDGKSIYLKLTSMDELKDILANIDEKESNIKQELDSILSKLT